MSRAELEEVLLVHSGDPRLLKGSILHTDGAKAYKNVGPRRWPAPGHLHDDYERDPPFAQFEWTHTNVCHSRKRGKQVRYVERKTIRRPGGEEVEVLGGTEKVDGFWAMLRAAMSRTTLNTGAAGTPARQWLVTCLRVFQWHYWHLHEDRFTRFGALVAARRRAAACSFF